MSLFSVEVSISSCLNSDLRPPVVSSKVFRSDYEKFFFCEGLS